MGIDQKQANDIKTELKRLFKSQAGRDNSNACLFNLIIYTDEPQRTQYFKDVLKMIISQFPCRIILIQTNLSSAVNHFQVTVTKEKGGVEGDFDCDQIAIEASGQDINRIYFLLLPLFVPDLPIYLIWGQDPTKENTILPHLQNFATRLIFDSEATEDLQMFSWDLQNRIESTPMQIVDMNWVRFGGWRDVLGQIFDSPERVQQLKASKLIRIFYNNCPSSLCLHAGTQAIYLQAWLSSRLKWQFQKAEKDNNSQVIFYEYDKSLREIHLIPKTDHDYDAGEIIEIYGEGIDYNCQLKRIGVDQIQVKSSNQYQCLLPFTLPMHTLRTGRSFMQEIFYQKISPHYAEMLKIISLFKWS